MAATWERRFRLPLVAWTAIAPLAPRRGLLASNRSGMVQLYAWDVATDDLRPLTDRPEGEAMGTLSADGRFVFYLDDRLGNEIGHFVRIPYEGGAPEDLTPDLPPYASFALTTSRSGGTLSFVAADPGGFHLYVLPPDGPARLLRDFAAITQPAQLSADGEMAIVATAEGESGLRFHLVALDTASGQVIAELSDGPESSVEVVRASPVPGDGRVLATTDRPGAKRPLLWNPHTGERTDLPLDLEGEVLPYDWSPDGDRILLCHFARAVQTLYLYSLAEGSARRFASPAGTYAGAYFLPDGDTIAREEAGGEIVAQWQDATNPTQPIVLDAETGALKRSPFAPAEVPPSRPFRSVSFPTTGGEEIQAWVATPEGDGPFPLVLHTHGGPTSVTTEQFMPGAQAWLDRGFAFISVNYRGSITFGRAYEQAIWGNLGELEVQDMVAARQWAVDAGVARPEEVYLTGGSYGGYLTLLALGREPDLWAGGMAQVAIADWAVQYEDSADTLRGYQRALFGGTPEELPEVYRRSSPMAYAERVRAPVIVFQGRNDTRCPARPMELYEARMRELGKAIEVVWFDAGHMGSGMDIERAITFQKSMLAFADRVQQGR